MARLRDPVDGCPWDLEQDFRSIAPYTIEEAYEVADAIEREAIDELPGELGDLLLQVVFHAQMARESGAFDFGDVVEQITTKMVRRHPHVFGDESVASAASQSQAWEALKREERAARGGGLLTGIAAGLPALTRAAKLGRRAAAVGFDWPHVEPVREKVNEELAELDAAVASGHRAAVEAEMGDVLFALVNLCRHLGLDPEQSLRAANARFERRFARVEAAIAEAGGDWSRFTLDELDAFWREAKSAES